MFLAGMSIGLYAAFLGVQTGRHRGYFVLDESSAVAHPAAIAAAAKSTAAASAIGSSSLVFHTFLLAAYMVPVCFWRSSWDGRSTISSKRCAYPPPWAESSSLPLVATPEAIGAVRSAMANRLQRSMNIFLGSVLSTIGLTIPIMIVVSHWTGRKMYLGVQNSSFVMLFLTLFLSARHFRQRPNECASGSRSCVAVRGLRFADISKLSRHGRSRPERSHR